MPPKGRTQQTGAIVKRSAPRNKEAAKTVTTVAKLTETPQQRDFVPINRVLNILCAEFITRYECTLRHKMQQDGKTMQQLGRCMSEYDKKEIRDVICESIEGDMQYQFNRLYRARGSEDFAINAWVSMFERPKLKKQIMERFARDVV